MRAKLFGLSHVLGLVKRCAMRGRKLLANANIRTGKVVGSLKRNIPQAMIGISQLMVRKIYFTLFPVTWVILVVLLSVRMQMKKQVGDGVHLCLYQS